MRPMRMRHRVYHPGFGTVHRMHRPYPSRGCERSGPVTCTGRAVTEEARLPKETITVWVRCCNKMHPVRVSPKGTLQIPAHKNIEAERMVARLGGKLPRCIEILDMWKGTPLKQEESYYRYEGNLHRKLATKLPKELERPYTAGVKQRTYRDRYRRFSFKTPFFKDDMAWTERDDFITESDDDDAGEVKTERPYWFRHVLPQMAMERLLMRELLATPGIGERIKGKKLIDRYMSYNPRVYCDTQDSYYAQTPDLTLDPYPWYGDEPAKSMGFGGHLDKSFMVLALHKRNRLKDGSLIVGMIRKGTSKHKRIVEGSFEIGTKRTLAENNDLYFALTKINTNVNRNDGRHLAETQMGIIDKDGNWVCLKEST